jgi:hypothetical protein
MVDRRGGEKDGAERHVGDEVAQQLPIIGPDPDTQPVALEGQSADPPQVVKVVRSGGGVLQAGR